MLGVRGGGLDFPAGSTSELWPTCVRYVLVLMYMYIYVDINVIVDVDNYVDNDIVVGVDSGQRVY